MTDRDTQQQALHILEDMEDPEVLRAWQLYTGGTSGDGLSMKAAAGKMKRQGKPIGETTVLHLLEKAEKVLGYKVRRSPGGGAHAGNTYRHNKKKRDITHTPRVNDD